MRRVIIITLAILMAIILNAQTPHLRFKGIAIDGNYKEFAQKLIQKEFKQVEVSNDGIVLVGNFMANPGTMVIIYPDPTSKAVSAVAAMLDAGDNWLAVESRYYDVVETYKQKYGEPTEHIEEFTKETRGLDSWKLHALQDGQCNYTSQWDVEGGKIAIKLAFFQYNYYVVCSYVDEENIKALRQTIIDDI